MLLIKLGGSVITDKSKLKTFRKAVVSRLSSELKTVKEDLIIVHGAGSFGHIKAKKHGLHQGYKSDRQLHAVGEVQGDVRALNLKVMECLRKEGLKPVSIPPSVVVTCSNTKIKIMDKGKFGHYIDLGLVPVTFGDVVLDEKIGFCICSGDKLMLELAKEFAPKNTIFVTNVDGIYTKNPAKKGAKLLKTITPNSTIDAGESSVVDVTDAMAGKLKTMFEISKYSGKTIVLNGNIKGRLRDAIKGKNVICTKVVHT
ncbi:MAG: isopentenyl phosphate kinase [Thermoplasmata archaeon]